MRARSHRIRRSVLGISAACSLGVAGPLTCFEAERPLSPSGLPGDLSFNFKKSVTTLSDGSVHAVWHAGPEGASRVFYRRSADGGATWEPPRPLSPPSPLPTHPAVAAAAGAVFVAWQAGGPDRSPRRRA